MKEEKEEKEEEVEKEEVEAEEEEEVEEAVDLSLSLMKKNFLLLINRKIRNEKIK